MKKYKKVIKCRMILCGVVVLFAAAIGAMDSFGVIEKILGERCNVNIAEFQSGLLLGIGILAVYLFVRYAQCIRSEDKLRFLYNNENDERKKIIKSRAGMPMLMITSGCMIFTGIIMGYFNEIIFITLILAAIAQMTLGAIVKTVSMKMM